MPRPNARRYLLLLGRPSRAARAEQARRLRELGLTVIAQYGTVALEADATAEEIEAARQTGAFSAVLKGPMNREDLARLGDEQRVVVRQWNSRFRPAYRRLTKDQTHRGKSWTAKGMRPPLAYTPIDPEDFVAAVADYERRTGQRLVEDEPPGKNAGSARTARTTRPLHA